MFALADRVLRGYTRVLDALAGLCLAIMVVLVFGNVVLRYTFNSGITISEELSRWLFVWLTFMGAVVALREHGHLGVDALVSRLPTLGKKICLVVAQVAMLYVSWLLLSGSWSQTVINWETEAPVTGASVGIFYASGVLMGASAIAILLRDLLRTLFIPLADHELIMVQESEEAAALEQIQRDAQAASDTPGANKP
ncbi:TRAP transporter small permease [Acidovorax sp. ACV01]|uniref:TRAP transporter small permease n=1 Tax=Acidovorax sp. ACV01 TaxID=2769311 RepID=UPI0017860964|nr:TRAP transporter small permease [Acidovorax sp. ACV01]MBD9393000.1 TRAP transporter small permease [Acidovorax sp. ACV01]